MSSFNRTIVELKCRLADGFNRYAGMAFNRTIVELKYKKYEGWMPKQTTFNRTIVELK